MKKCLIMALAAFGLAACADNFDETNTPVHNGELEESYIAINLMSADRDTRAATDSYGYEDGTAAERAINSAYFFFFDENGNPFNVIGDNNGATAPGAGKNYLQLAIGAQEDSENVNVSDIRDAVLILNTYKGIYPKQIVAVLNWTPSANTYTLDKLHESLATIYDKTQGYVMSNSVYMSSNKVVDAVPLTDANIKTSAADAKANPVNIYVERTAAKVVLTASGKVATDNIFSTQTTSSLVTLDEITSTPVFVKLHGWELYNDYNTSSLLKNIDPTWSIDDLGLTWNDSPYYRCYWAQSQTTDPEDSFSWKYENHESKGFKTVYGFNVASSVDANYTDGTTYTYCGENTNQLQPQPDGTDYRTKVILKGQLMQKDGETTYKPLELARWYGNEYAGVDNLKKAVANSLAYTLYSSSDQVTYTPIQPEDIECVTTIADLESYEVGFQLSEEGKAKTWYKYSSENKYQEMAEISNLSEMITKTNAYLAGVEPALIYKSGQTYYIVDIEHLGNAGAKYGVVRNHVYQIDIKSIKGYGSPVYNGIANIVTPEYPEKYESSYVAAKINVLSWKIVKQGVNIVQ